MSPTNLDVSPITVPSQQTYNGQPFPLVLACRSPGTALDAAAAWVADHRRQLLRQAADHGAILFRGFPLATAGEHEHGEVEVRRAAQQATSGAVVRGLHGLFPFGM